MGRPKKAEYEKTTLKEATAKCWCSKTGKVFGIVVAADNVESWMVRHSFLCSAHYVDAASECSGKIGQVQISNEYNGCKHCGNNSLVQGDQCKEYSCFNAGGFSPIETVKCGNCGMRGVVSGMAKSMTISGD